MHFLTHLLRYFPFTVIVGQGGGDTPPAGMSFVVTSRGSRVVTSRTAFVIAKEY